MCKRFVPALVAFVVLACAFAATASAEVQCASCRPWWHVNTVSAPANPAGGEGSLVVEVSDVGDAMVDGIDSPVTVVDKLPAGVTPTAVFPEGGGGNIGLNDAQLFSSCSLAAQTVTCTYSGPLLAYERLIIEIHVKVAPGTGGGGNEVRVGGGGAPTAVLQRALALSDSTPPFGAENYELDAEEEGGAPDTQAGSHPFQLTTTLVLNTSAIPTLHDFPLSGIDEVMPEVQPRAFTKDLRFNLPAGLVGNPTPLPKCSMYVFTQAAAQLGPPCPDNTVVGVATPIIGSIDVRRRVPYAFSAPLYSLVPSVGEPARFGFRTAAGPVILDTSVRTGGDYGVVVTVPNITDLAEFIGNQVTFWGVPSDSRHDTTRGTCLDQSNFESESPEFETACPIREKTQPLLLLPTSCTGPLRTSVEADPWSAPGQFTAPKEYIFQNPAGEPYGLDGCNRLNFEPSISVAPDGQEGSTPTGLTVGVHVPQEASLNPTGLAESTVKDTTVSLPAGVGLNPAGADGLSACGLGEIGLESPAEQSCPESAKVGTVEIRTPLLPNPLTGAAYLAQQNANPFGSLVALYIVAKDPVSGVLVKLAGQVTPDPVTGQLVSTFKETPQLPFEDLSLHFFGGSRAPLGTPALCGSYTTTGSIVPWSGSQAVDSSSEFRVTSGPNGTPCSNPLPFSPSLTTGSTNLQAGAFSPFTMTMSRETATRTCRRSS